jgi:hypothetical protein
LLRRRTAGIDSRVVTHGAIRDVASKFLSKATSSSRSTESFSHFSAHLRCGARTVQVFTDFEQKESSGHDIPPADMDLLGHQAAVMLRNVHKPGLAIEIRSARCPAAMDDERIMWSR